MRAKSTIDQWLVLEEIVRTGSFERAARALHMSQSSVSYAIAKLQSALGVQLLQTEGRKARLTKEGTLFLLQARPLLRGFATLEAQAEQLARGEEISLRIAADAAFPDSVLFPVLARFQQLHPTVHLSLQQKIRLTVDQAMGAFQADLCIGSLASARYSSKLLFSVELLAAAHRAHPLYTLPSPLSNQDLAEHVMVQISDSMGAAPPETFIEGCRTWNVNTIHAAIAAVEQGACFGWLPRLLIKKQLQRKELKPLPLASGAERSTQLFLSVRSDMPSHSVAHKLVTELVTATNSFLKS